MGEEAYLLGMIGKLEADIMILWRAVHIIEEQQEANKLAIERGKIK